MAKVNTTVVFSKEDVETILRDKAKEILGKAPQGKSVVEWSIKDKVVQHDTVAHGMVETPASVEEAVVKFEEVGKRASGL